MGDLDRAIQMASGLVAVLDDVLERYVGPVVKDAIVRSAQQNVYDAYEPQFYSRWGGNGGILDPSKIRVEVRNGELTAVQRVGWQHLWGGKKPDGLLADAIASGNPRYNMGKAGPRPFHEKAREMLLAEGEMEAALRRGLESRGIDTAGMNFRFE